MKKIITFIIILCMVIPLTSFSTQSSNQPAIQTISRDAIPEIVPYSQVEQAGHAKRLYSQENELNSIIFENTDGTNSLYMFSENVKYIDSDGKVKDKSNKLSAVNDEKSIYAYTNEQNDVKTFFPKQLSVENGIKLAYNNIKVNLYPNTDIISTAKKESYVDKDGLEKDNIIYNNVFGENTAISYSCLFEGFKEDIILYKDIKINTFSFILKTNGLTLKEVDGLWLLYDKDEKVGRLGSLYVYDSANNCTYDNKLEVKELGESSYQLTIIVDETFLKEAKYPVTIDPTLTINTLGSGTSKTIQDATIFSGDINFKGGTMDKIYTGYVNTMIDGTSKGVARALIKIPGLYESTIFSSIAPSQILSAELKLYETFGVPISSNISTRFYLGNVWSESDLTYYTASPNNYSSSYGSLGISGSGWQSFDMTEITDLWKRYTYHPEKGLMLLNSNESNTNYCKYFNSTEASSNKPYFVLNYSLPAPLAEGLYTIQELFSENYISTYQYEDLIFTSTMEKEYVDTHASTSEVWYLKPYADGSYEISSVYVKHAASNGVTRYSLGITSAMNYTVDLVPNSTSANQRWFLEGSGFTLINIRSAAMTNYYLSQSNGSPSVSTSKTYWNFTPFEPPHVYAGRYSGNTTNGNPVNIKVTYDASYFNNTQVTPGMLECLGLWNGLSSKVTVYTPSNASSAPAGSYSVTYKTFTAGTEFIEGVAVSRDALGLHVPHKPTQNPDDWTDSNIYILKSGFNNTSVIYEAIIHELGHALKIRHPNVYYTYGDFAVVSVMNWGSCTDENSKAAIYPTVYDMMTLRKKWGN